MDRPVTAHRPPPGDRGQPGSPGAPAAPRSSVAQGAEGAQEAQKSREALRVAAEARRGGGARAGRLATGVLGPACTAAVAVFGLWYVPGGISPLDAVAFGLSLAWALAGAIAARNRERAPQWPVASGALVAAVALTAARLGSQGPAGQHEAARAVATLAAPQMVGWAGGRGASLRVWATSPRFRPGWRSRWLTSHSRSRRVRQSGRLPFRAPCQPFGSATAARPDSPPDARPDARPASRLAARLTARPAAAGSECSGSGSARSWPQTSP